MTDDLVEKLSKSGISEFEVTDKISKEDISILGDTKNTIIYIPLDLEEEVYRIDDFLRREARFLRTSLGNCSGRNDIKTISIQGSLTVPQYIKLVKYIIEETDFCNIFSI